MADERFLKSNLGTRNTLKLRPANFPSADAAVLQGIQNTRRSPDAVDILLVNPPAPDGGIWIRSQHRVGRRSRENMVWPQVSLAQFAALLVPVYTVKIIDAIGERLTWKEFTEQLDRYQPKYYLTQVTAPTLENDMYGVFLARSRGARTMAFGTHVTPIPIETMRAYPALDFVLSGEPDLTLRDLLDHLEGRIDQRSPEINRIFKKQLGYKLSLDENNVVDMHAIQGVAWRRGDEITVNPARPFIGDLDDLTDPAASYASFKELSHAYDARAVHIYRVQPRMPGRMHLLH